MKELSGRAVTLSERLAMVHVCSHSRQRHNVVTVMTFASVSTILPLQNGQSVWRVTGPVNCESGMVFTPFL